MHAVDAPAPALSEYEPALQCRQVRIFVAAITDEYVPARQFVHAIAAAADQEPGLQLVHVLEPAAEYEPELHDKQTFARLAPTVVEYWPAAQFVHVFAAEVSEYEPGEHCAHAVEPEGE